MRERIQAEIARVCDTQRFILGADVETFERRFAEYCSARHAIGCASGTDALELALMAAGVGPGDEVLTVPFTFFATAGAILSAGARPVFVDVEPASFNLDTAQLEAVLARHPSVKAILPVHLYGGCADMDPILKGAAALGIPVIEDAAQAVGAECRGQRAGSLGSMGCFSFFPTKNLGGAGDGGIRPQPGPVIAVEGDIAATGAHRRRQIKQIQEEYKTQMDKLREGLTEALSNILLGEKIPLDVINGERHDHIMTVDRAQIGRLVGWLLPHQEGDLAHAISTAFDLESLA